MEIIPVIDLMHGQVVHAKHGQRESYQPLQSLLCAGSAPLEVLKALLELYPFTTIYIADIDAIQGLGNHFEIISSMAIEYPHINFWLDYGIRQVNEISLINKRNIRLVIGTENMEDFANYQAISLATSHHHILSLDFQNDRILGPSKLHTDSQHWPADVISMTLTQVGSGLGVDMEQLNTLSELNLTRKMPSKLFAAGGIRNIDDCLKLKTMGIAGVLVASALHKQTITADDIKSFACSLQITDSH